MTATAGRVPGPAALGQGRRGQVKCVVWDLDNTVWDGVLLEDCEVTLRPEVVDVMRALDERGILHSIASRNDRQAALDRIEQFGLSEYFLYPQISWGAKSEAVARIARELNIGIDALAFVDDQIFELEEVAFAQPDVLCVPVDQIGGILATPEFSPRFITDESAQRRSMYQSSIARNEAEQEHHGTNEEFLASLDMELTIATAAEEDLQRAEELTIRTNQLNSTGVTYSYADLDRYRCSADHLLLVASLVDRFGSYGKIGLALIDQSDEVWRLKLLLMSCRVMSRGVGGVLLNHIMGLARERAVGLEAEFAHTGRNRLMYITYRFAGFSEARTDGDTTLLRADLDRVQQPRFLRLRLDGVER